MKKKSSNKQLAEALYQVTRGLKGEKLHQALNGFVAFLFKTHRLKQAPRIIDEFVRCSKKADGVQEIELTAARKLNTNVIENIKKVFGNKVEETIVIDENILGGIKIKTGDKIFDASLKSQLNNLEKKLSN